MNRRHCRDVASCRPAGRRERRGLLDGTDYQVVDPDLSQAGAAVQVQDQLIDISVGEVDVAVQLDPQELLLLTEQLDGVADLQRVPAADSVVFVAADGDGERLVEAVADMLVRQDDAGQQANTWAVGFHPNVDAQFFRDRRPSEIVNIMNERALLRFEANEL